MQHSLEEIYFSSTRGVRNDDDDGGGEKYANGNISICLTYGSCRFYITFFLLKVFKGVKKRRKRILTSDFDIIHWIGLCIAVDWRPKTLAIIRVFRWWRKLAHKNTNRMYNGQQYKVIKEKIASFLEYIECFASEASCMIQI